MEVRTVAGSRPASRTASWNARSRSPTDEVTPSVAAPSSSGNVSHWSAQRAARRSIRGRWAAISNGIRGCWTGRGSKTASSRS